MRSLLIIITVTLFACATQPIQVGEAPPEGNALTVSSLPDGTSRTDGAADQGEVCVESEELGVKSCYARGEPILDPETQRVIGFQMIMTSLDVQP